MHSVTWYFDFVSPFAYLASHRLDAITEHAGVTCRPVLFAGLLQHFRHKGPAEIEPKRTFTYRHVQWLAGRDGIALRVPAEHPFNPLPYLRLSIVLDNTPAVVKTIFDALWQHGASAADPATFAALADRLGVADPARRIGAPDVKQALRENTEQAVARGVFGVPTFVVGDELFWGYDAIEFLLDYLENPALLDTPAMREAAAARPGISREV